MKNLLNRMMVAGLICCVVLIAACSQKSGTGTVRTIDGIKITNGWVDENTIRASGTGKAAEGEKSAEKQKKDTEGKAIKSAKYAMIVQMEAMRIEAADRNHEYDGRFAEIFNSGKIIYISWNAKTGECTVIYEISRKDLKKTLQQILGGGE